MKKTEVSKMTLSKAKKAAWKVFSLYIRTRDKGICYTCGKNMSGSRAYHAGHFISRQHSSVMFNETNVKGQCMYCNMYLYGNSGIFAENLIRDIGIEEFQKLLAKGRQIKKFTIPELITLKETYEKKLKSLSPVSLDSLK